ncbi:MAG: hypothetical protein K2G63_06940 [Oscillospiraceae bacterium]|nr:hypothetical protein [Oscillospiraceae bacterium]
MNIQLKVLSGILSSSILMLSAVSPLNINNTIQPEISVIANAVTIDDFPSEYQYAADWIWQNRIEREQSTVRKNTIFDQIVAGKGTLNYVVRWQSYKPLTFEQRKGFQAMLEKCYNDWNKWLAGYENWPYEHININIVGWAVFDKNLLLDLQPDEKVYDDIISDYDSTYDTSNGVEEIPDKLPSAPIEISRCDHFEDPYYEYPNGYENRFDMYLWGTQGFPSIGGCGGDWGQRLSDDAYINMIDGTGIHVLEHEVGHGFGMTDFYGGEGDIDGFPPGGFPDDGTSIMMAGSSIEITNFDGWFLRYMWSKLKDEENRFDLSPVQTPETTTTTANTTTTVTTASNNPDSSTKVVNADFVFDEESKWNFNANNAEYVELIFKGNPFGGIAGKLNDIEWDLRFSESDTASVKIELPKNTYESVIEKIYSGVWSNEVNDMIDMPIELKEIKLYYSETPALTTEHETTETDIIIKGDANDDGVVDVADVVAIASYVGDASSNKLSKKGIINADVHSSGNGLDANDALMVQQYLAKIVSW